MSIILYNKIKDKYNNKNNINKELIEYRNIEYNKFKLNNLNFKIYNDNDNECCICLTNINNNEYNDDNDELHVINNINLLLLECGHYFHLYCIYNPVNNNLNIQNCPLCRENIKHIIPSNIDEYTLYNLIINNQLMNKFFNDTLYVEEEIINIIHNFINYNVELECMKIFQYESFNNKVINKSNFYFKNKDEILKLININDIIQFIYIISNKFMNTHNINIFFNIYDNSHIKNINWLNSEQYFILNIIFYKILSIMIDENTYNDKLMFVKNIYSNTYLYNLSIIDNKIYNKINMYFNKINNFISINNKKHFEYQTNNNVYHTLLSNIFNYSILIFMSSNKNLIEYIELTNNNNDIPLTNFLRNTSFIKLSPIKNIINIIKKFSNDNILQLDNNPLFTFIFNCLINNKFYNNLSIKKILTIIQLLIDKEQISLTKKIFNDNYTCLSFYILHINKMTNLYNYINDENTIYYNTNPLIVKQKNNEITKIIELLINKNQSNLFDVDNLYKTPLHISIERKFINFKILIDKNKHLLFYKDINNLYPIHYFILNNINNTFNSLLINHLIDVDKNILNILDDNKNNMLQFYLAHYNHYNIRSYIIKTLKNNNDDILLNNNIHDFNSLHIYLKYTYVSYEILIDLIDSNKNILYHVSNNTEQNKNIPLIMYILNCINIDEKCIKLLSNNYDHKILNYQNIHGNTPLNIFIETYFNKLQNKITKKNLNILKSLITPQNILFTNIYNYNSLQCYLQNFLYDSQHLNNCNIINNNVVKYLIDNNKKCLYNLHTIGKSPIYMLMIYSSNYFKNNLQIIDILTNNYDKELLFNYYNNYSLIELYINNSYKIYMNILSILLGYEIKYVNHIKSENIKNLLKNKKII
jgi:hypothetical protein